MSLEGLLLVNSRFSKWIKWSPCSALQPGTCTPQLLLNRCVHVCVSVDSCSDCSYSNNMWQLCSNVTYRFLKKVGIMNRLSKYTILQWVTDHKWVTVTSFVSDGMQDLEKHCMVHSLDASNFGPHHHSPFHPLLLREQLAKEEEVDTDEVKKKKDFAREK